MYWWNKQIKWIIKCTRLKRFDQGEKSFKYDKSPNRAIYEFDGFKRVCEHF